MNREARDSAAAEKLIHGVHPVMERLGSRPGEVERILIAREAERRLGRLLRLARQAGIPVTRLPRNVFSRRVGGRSNQGVAAVVGDWCYSDLSELLQEAESKPAARLLFVDRVVDAGNLGALVRTAAGAGCDGIVLSAEDTAGLSAGVAKASAGALEHIAIARDPHPPRTLRRLREAGFLLFALDAKGETDWNQLEIGQRIIVVAGGEQRGVRQGILDVCDCKVRIPLSEEIESLNVAVATGVLLFEFVRRAKERPSGS